MSVAAGKAKGAVEAFQNGCHNFISMLKNEGKFNGRNRKGNGMLFAFYIIYYAILALILYLWIQMFYQNSNPSGHVPKLHGRGLQSPGLTYEPRLRKAYGNHKKHIENLHKPMALTVAFNYKSGEGDIYVDQMKNFLENEGRNLSDYGDFGSCNTTDFGFKSDKPCLFFRVNKVIDWEPAGVMAGDFDRAFGKADSNAFSRQGYCSESRFGKWCGKNQDRISAMADTIFSNENSTYTKPFIHCMHHSGAGAAEVPVTYYPSNGELDFQAPFKGKDQTAGRKGGSIYRSVSQKVTNERYKTPLVAVQFDFSSSVAKNTEVQFHCFAFDRNIEIDTKTQSSGMLKVYMKVST